MKQQHELFILWADMADTSVLELLYISHVMDHMTGHAYTPTDFTIYRTTTTLFNSDVKTATARNYIMDMWPLVFPSPLVSLHPAHD